MNTYYIDIADQSIKTNIGYGDIKLQSLIAYTSALDLQNIILYRTVLHRKIYANIV